MRIFVALALFAVAIDAKAVLRRQAQNSYGDEQPVAAAPAPVEPAPVEQTVEVVEQPAAVPEVASADSGYRAKRQAQNSYGDEQPVAEAAQAPVEAPAEPAPVEQAAEPAYQPAAAAPEVASADSGYRAKRQAQNSYGDEQPVAQAAQAPVEAPVETPVEQTVEVVEQPAAAAPEVASADSGYRAKRQAQNSYGDEQPVAEAAQAPVEAPAEPAPVEQAAEPAYQPAAAAPEVASADSGYRAKRQAQNSYGDEQPVAAAPAPAEPAPVEQTVEVVEQPAAVPEVASADSGYRAKRQAQNSYGDEQPVAEAAQAPVEAPAEPAPVEQAAEPAYQPAAAAPEVASADSGYRA